MQESRESRIEQKIEDIYSFVESCKMQRLSATRVIVPKDELYDLLDDLRRDIPAEIKRYRKIFVYSRSARSRFAYKNKW